MAIDMDTMLAKIKDRQWALADIDWDAPGADTITDEQRPKPSSGWTAGQTTCRCRCLAR